MNSYPLRNRVEQLDHGFFLCKQEAPVNGDAANDGLYAGAAGMI
jgi:hypothetical protein